MNILVVISVKQRLEGLHQASEAERAEEHKAGGVKQYIISLQLISFHRSWMLSGPYVKGYWMLWGSHTSWGYGCCGPICHGVLDVLGPISHGILDGVGPISHGILNVVGPIRHGLPGCCETHEPDFELEGLVLYLERDPTTSIRAQPNVFFRLSSPRFN